MTQDGGGSGSWLLAIWEVNSKHVVHLEMKRVLNLWCQCDTEMWSLGLALQHTKADRHRVTFFEIIHGLRPLEKNCAFSGIECAENCTRPCLFHNER